MWLPLQHDFLGGGLINYLGQPYLWSWANFDGEHYLAIAQQGYSPLRYFFFPVYPLIIRYLALDSGDLFDILLSGLFVSNISFFIGLVGLWKLMRLDFKRSIVVKTILLLIIFPTSFYFGSIYTESTFLALTVWTFYFVRKGNFIVSGVLGSLLTATRIVGLAFIPALFVELLHQKKWNIRNLRLSEYFYLILIPSGLFLYMLYLNKVTGDPLDFFHNIAIYGEQRSTGLILLPQVFYRYIFKIIPNLNYSYFPVVFTTLLEFVVALGCLLLVCLNVLNLYLKHAGKRIPDQLKSFAIRESYVVYFLIAFTIPTLSGSFSSIPRYVLILFPIFITIAKFLTSVGRKYEVLYFLISLLGLFVACSLFVRGYWVA
jgi:Gpi18-like mannosyltransferase